jgi:hypothetical protein
MLQVLANTEAEVLWNWVAVWFCVSIRIIHVAVAVCSRKGVEKSSL